MSGSAIVEPPGRSKQPVLVVAAYSALLLASLQAFGIERGKAYLDSSAVLHDSLLLSVRLGSI